MALIAVNWNPSRTELRQFAGIWLGFFGLVGYLARSQAGPSTASFAIWVVAAVVGGIGLLWPSMIRPLYVGWLTAAQPIGWAVSHLLLVFIFYGIIAPIGWLARCLKHDPMRRTFDRSASTYWEPHNPAGDPARYFRQL
jgi:hypothetical protein